MDRKNIVICGCTSGIGLSTAESLSKQGNNLFLIGRSEEKLINLASQLDNAPYYVLDLSTAQEKDFDQMAVKCRRYMDKLDGLIYTAGVPNIMPIRSITRDSVENTFRVNLYGFISIIRSVLEHLDCSGASIVGISSGAAQTPAIGQSIYAASKAAMNIAIQALASELLDKKIRINTIMPGIVDTKMIKEAEATGTMSIERFRKFRLWGYSSPKQSLM